MKSEKGVGTALIVSNTLVLFVATAFCVLSYPDLAIRINAWLGGPRGSGSSLGYVRDFYVLPAALVFLLLAAVALSLAARRGRRSVGITAMVAWLVLIASLVGSVEWYFAAVKEASELR